MNSQFVELPGLGPAHASSARPPGGSGPPQGSGSEPNAGPTSLSIEYRWINPQYRDGPLLIFLHEGLGSVAMWKSWPQDLCDAAKLRALVFSRPGYGRSTPRVHAQRWQPDYLHRQATEILPALLARLGVASHPAWLIGHSDGASIALLYAAAFPEHTRGVVALAPHVFVEPISLQGIRAAREAYLHASLRNKLSRYHDDVDSAFWGWNDIWLDPAFAAWNIEAQLAQIRAPVLVIQGEDDEYGSSAHLQRILAQVPGATALELEQCGHAPQRDCPHLVNPAILEFIGAARQRGTPGLATDSGR